MRLLVAIDSVNFHGGAHAATWSMIDALKLRGVQVEVLTCSKPNDGMSGRLADEGIHVIQDAFPRRGWRFFVQGICRKAKLGWVPNWSIDPCGDVRRLIKNFDTVLVVGENSHLRNLIGSVHGPRKVVFIHTDYVAWRQLDPWAPVDSRWDSWIYRQYDCIAVVGSPNAMRFARFFPQFKNKVNAFHNLMPKRVHAEVRVPEKFTISTFGRLNWGAPKSTEMAIRVAARLKSRGCDFVWRSYGGIVKGDELKLQALVKELGVQDVFQMPGYCCDVLKKMTESTVVAHLSSYEGLSNTIYESLLQGIPVIATDVGGASGQIRDGFTGRVVENDEASIVQALYDAIRNREQVERWRRNLAGYVYDNEKIVDEYLELLR